MTVLQERCAPVPRPLLDYPAEEPEAYVSLFCLPGSAQCLFYLVRACAAHTFTADGVALFFHTDVSSFPMALSSRLEGRWSSCRPPAHGKDLGAVRERSDIANNSVSSLPAAAPVLCDHSQCPSHPHAIQ